MTRLEDIRAHDLVYIDDEECKGWHIVIAASKQFIVVYPLGESCRQSRLIIWDRSAGRIKKHLRMAAVPGAIEAHEHIQEYWNGDQNERAMADALNHIIDTSSDALRAVRGENGTSISN